MKQQNLEKKIIKIVILHRKELLFLTSIIIYVLINDKIKRIILAFRCIDNSKKFHLLPSNV